MNPDIPPFMGSTACVVSDCLIYVIGVSKEWKLSILSYDGMDWTFK